MDDLELPPPPEQTARRPRPSLLTRKRTRDEFAEEIPTSAASSDPALFSGDEQVPGAEDYAIKRKKKLYSGSWFNHQMKANKGDRKKEFKRNFDSGIFMGSESSDIPSSDSLGSLDEELIEDERRKESAMTGQHILSNTLSQRGPRITKLPVKPRAPAMSEKHATVMKVVHNSLEREQAMVDLSGFELDSLPTDFTTLSTLSRPAGFAAGMLEDGRNFETRLLLYLSNNLFTTIPTEILNLNNIAELSLRNNQLTHIPPGIRSLVNLRELNIAHNQLTYLPFEIIELAYHHSLRTIHSDGNQWAMPPDVTPMVTRSCYPGPMLFRLHRVLPDYSTGTLVAPKSGVPSLMESTLRALLRLDDTNDFRKYIPSDVPGPVFDALKVLDDWGGHRCSRCDCVIVQEGYQELEWWANRREPLGELLPYMRTFCNTECAEGRKEAFKQPWRPRKGEPSR
jgi:hypothetical protein